MIYLTPTSYSSYLRYEAGGYGRGVWSLSPRQASTARFSKSTDVHCEGLNFNRFPDSGMYDGTPYGVTGRGGSEFVEYCSRLAFPHVWHILLVKVDVLHLESLLQYRRIYDEC